MVRAIRIKPLYSVDIGRFIDGKSYDVEIAKLWGFTHAIIPGRWLPNQAAAKLWTAWTIEREMWKSLRRWKNNRPYIR